MNTESIETTVARLDERFNGFSAILKQMAADQERMAASYEELVKSNQRLALIEADVVAAKASLAKLWEKSDALELARIGRDQKRAEDELSVQKKEMKIQEKERHRWKRELAIGVVPSLIMLVAYHFGVRL
jgi:hypothetical protein